MPFQELFDALSSNDFDQASRSSSDGLCTLVTNVQGSAVEFTTLKLCLSSILDLPSKNVSAVDATTRTLSTIGDINVAVLLSWIQQCPTLRDVQLRCRSAVVHDSRNAAVQALVRRILKAMVQNPSIQTLTSYLETGLSWWSLSEYLETPNGQRLRSLRLESVQSGIDDSVMEAAARAIGNLRALHTLALRAGGSMLIEQFLPHLMGHATLQELEINFMCQRLDESLVRVLETCPRLKKVALQGFNAKTHHWSSVSAALQSNPSIAQLQLGSCSFSKEATTLFFRDWSSIDPTRQHVRHLTLLNCAFADVQRQALHDCFRNGSLIQHFIIDGYTLSHLDHWAYNGRSIFDTLMENTALILLVSLHLKNITSRTLRHASRYVAVVNRLHSLAIAMKQPVDHDALKDFVQCVRVNASVKHVIFQVPSSTLATKRTRRLVKAMAKRNRLLPRVMDTLFKVAEPTQGPQSSRLAQQPLRAALLQLPALCVASIQTPPTSPSNVLKGLLAAPSSWSSNDAMGHTDSTAQKRTQGNWSA